MAAGDSLYFTISKNLWISDGTAEGTKLLPGAGDLGTASLGGVLDGVLYFSAADTAHGSELWRTDGTPNGTRIVKDINPGVGSSGPGDFTLFRGELYFGASDGVHGWELWKTDGTEQGTIFLGDATPGPGSSRLMSLRAGGNGVYFIETTFDMNLPSSVYASDGTPPGVRLVRQFPNAPGYGSGLCPNICTGLPPGAFAALGDSTYFIGSDGMSGFELWRSDGTTQGTARVKDICPGFCSAFLETVDFGEARLLRAFNGRLYFFADDGIHGFMLWTSDGTEAGTRLAVNFPAYGPLFDVGAALFLLGHGSNSWSVWRTDGTEAGTLEVASGKGTIANWVTAVGDDVYFSADKGSEPRRLWRSSSAGAPARIVTDQIEDPIVPVSFRGSLYFFTKTPEGLSLWKTTSHDPHDVPFRR